MDSGSSKIDMLNSGKLPIYEPGLSQLWPTTPNLLGPAEQHPIPIAEDVWAAIAERQELMFHHIQRHFGGRLHGNTFGKPA